MATKHGLKDRDKYGRSMVRIYEGRNAIGAVVLLPRTARDRGMYLSNDWTLEDRSDREKVVQYHSTRGEALARFGLKAGDVR